MIIECLFIR